MKPSLKSLAEGLALAAGLTACGCGTSGTAPIGVSDPKAVQASIDASLDRLRTLQIVDVTTLVMNLPAEATACYGVPCPGPSGPQAYQARRAAPPRALGKLA